MPFIDDITCTIYDMSSTVYDSTFTICVTLHNACISDITHSRFMAYPRYIASHTVLWQHNHCVTSQPLCLKSHPLYLCHHTQWINFIKPSVCMTSQPLCVWHHMHYLWHHIHSLGHHTTLCMTSDPLYLTSLPLYLCHHTHPINDITATVCMTSHPVYPWHHIYYIYDIISTKYDITTLYVYDATPGICMTSFALQMTTHPLYHIQPTVFMMSHPLQGGQHSPCIRHRTHCIFVITTSPLISHPLLYDITPTICVTSYALYITSYPLLMSSQYCTYESTTLTYETTSSTQFKIYTIHLTSQSVVCVITHTIFDIVSTVSVSSHSLYWWYHKNCISEITSTIIHDIISIVYDMTATGSVS